MSHDITAALEHDKYAIGQLISLFEDERPHSAQERSAVIEQIQHSPASKRGSFIGITGTPGAGKSTLIGELATRLIASNPELSVAVVAIDPSSHLSGGSLLGDRTRVQFPLKEKRLFFRSQSSAHELGGISPHTFQVCRLLHYLFDIILIETVGIGQNEIAIRDLADRTYLILQPLGGDQIQFMKAGIMEIPDVFVINKCDAATEAQRSYHNLKASLGFVRPEEHDLTIFQTSALTGLGLPELMNDIDGFAGKAQADLTAKESVFFEKWIREEYGRSGLRLIQQDYQSPLALLTMTGSFDQAQARVRERFSS